MHSIRKWFYRPKKEDSSKLAQFYWADEELTMIATELDSFDGRTDPDRCSILVSQLRVCQDKVLGICNEIMDEAIPSLRANRDFRVKFPDDVLHETLAGQLWFGAECLAAGSNIMNREQESENMRPLAKALTRSLDNVRCLLREQSLKSPHYYSDKVKESLRIFDRLFAEFELCYVSAMVPIKTAKEYHTQQEIVVLFSETLLRALKIGLVTQDMVDDYDPSLMFTIPRLAIVWGLLIYTEGPLNVDKDPLEMSELFRTFYPLLFKIRSLLWTLTRVELQLLEKMLCSLEEPQIIPSFKQIEHEDLPIHDSEHYINIFYQTHRSCKQFIQDFYAYNFGVFLGEDETNNVSYSNILRQNVNFQGDLETVRNDEELENVPERNVLCLSEVLNCDNTGASSDDSTLCKKSKLQHLEECETLRKQSEGNCSSTNEISVNSYSNSCQSPECSSEISHLDEIDAHQSSFDGSDNRTGVIRIYEQTEQLNSNSSGSLEEYGKCNCQNTLQKKSHSTQEFLCLEHCLSISHERCLFNTDTAPLTEAFHPMVLASQTINQTGQLSSQHYHVGYSSSPESSSQTFLPPLSHSFPIHSSNDTLRNYFQRNHISGHYKRRRHILQHKRLHYPRFHCDISTTQSVENPSDLACTCLQSNIYCSRNEFRRSSTPLSIPRVQELREPQVRSTQTSSSCSSCQSVSSASGSGWEDSTSPETSSYNSECQDDEEIALALQAVEIASHNEARARFKSSDDLLHRLFVCISGVADQLQTNNASDLRNILKSVFDMNCSEPANSLTEESCNHDSGNIGPLGHFVTISSMENSLISNALETSENLDESIDPAEERENVISVEVTTQIPEVELLRGEEEDDERDQNSVDSAEEVIPDHSPTPSLDFSTDRRESITLSSDINATEDPPPWLPDELSDSCMACEAPFTLLRRRHHCRNCGKIFCSKCSSNSIPLPRYGHLKPVRVCNQCFMYQITTLVVQQQF